MSSMRSLSVSVRDLVEFALRTGDLGGDRDFVSPARALEGARAHRQIQKSRPAGYEAEVALSHTLEADGILLTIRGRLDGVLRTLDGALIEEIKTHLGPWAGAADPLHWAQGKIYGFLYLQRQTLPRIEIQLTYVDLRSHALTVFRESFAAEELAAFFSQVTAVYLQWLRMHHCWSELRNESILHLTFPYPKYRRGQQSMTLAAHRACLGGGLSFIEAPTGIGKTVSVLFPAVKALGERLLDKVFYLTAKTSGRVIAENTLAELRRAGLRLRSVTLTAKDKICFAETPPCDLQNCPFAIGYFDRIKAAVANALQREDLDRPAIQELARQHQVCPFELSLDASLWVDVIICDYNYAFDPRVLLRRYFTEEAGAFVFLVDEAHNLVDRAREMFSADLDQAQISEVKRAVQRDAPACAKALERIRKRLSSIDSAAALVPGGERTTNGQPEALFPQEGEEVHQATMHALGVSRLAGKDPVAQPNRGVACTVAKEFPADLLPLLRTFLQEAEAWLGQDQAAPSRESLLELYFRVNGFLRTAELYDDRYVTLCEGAAPRMRLRLYCLDPSLLLGKALRRSQTAILFSATLTPLDYFREMLGGDAGDPMLQLESPFPCENLCVLVEDGIATNLKDRPASYGPVADAIAALARARRGNYLVYFPSYEYLNQVRGQFVRQHPDLSTLAQTPAMSESDRAAFLEQFHDEHEQTLVGFAVLGGVFGEGIDLVGDRLIGAVIVGVGLPQLSLERDRIRDYFEAKNGRGFDYAYTFPGLNRVLQAAGRVIRSETDQGVVLLIDARFRQPRYRKLFPAWWQPRRVRGTDQVGQAAREFWEVSSERRGFTPKSV